MATLTSADGTLIGYDVQGSGPAVILIEGALGYRAFGVMTKIAELLPPRLKAITYDRRGRGESGDTLPYDLEREVEDLNALIDVAGGSASLAGMSSGGCLALEATLRLSASVEKLAMYEPAYNSQEGGVAAWRAYSDQLAVLLADGRNDDAVALFMAFVGTPADMIEGMRHSPMWQQLEPIAATLAYDAAAIGADQRPPLERAASIGVPTLVVSGSVTIPFLAQSAKELAVAIPNGNHVTLEGQAHDVAPAALAPVLAEFLAT